MVIVKLLRLQKLEIIGKRVLWPVKIIRPVPFGPSLQKIQLAPSSGPVLIEEEIATLSLDTTNALVNLMDLEIVF